MIILNLEQGTKEWQDARRCMVTGTKLQKVMGTPEAQRGQIAELIAEEATEQSKVFTATAEMERGTTEEVFAIRAFEKRTGKKVTRVGMCISDKHPYLGLSPDGLIGTPGNYEEAVEVKCPDSKKAILYRIENMIPMDETGLLSKFTKSEMVEVLEQNHILHNPKATIAELEPLLPEGQKGKPSSSAPFLGIPTEYKWQVVDYFLVNEKLKTLYFLVYDERFIDEESKLYVVEVKRENEVLQEAMAEATKELEAFREKWMKWKEIVLPSKF